MTNFVTYVHSTLDVVGRLIIPLLLICRDFDLTDFGASVGKVKNTANFDWTADLEKGGGFDLFRAFEIPSSPEKFRPENSPHVQALQKGIEDLPVFKDPTEEPE